MFVTDPWSFNVDPTAVTADATPTTIFSIQIPSNNTCMTAIAVMARGQTSGDSAAFFKAGLIKNLNNTVTILGPGLGDVLSPIKDAGAALWDIAFSVTGTTLLVKVTGSLTESVGWRIRGGVYGFTNANYD